MYPIGVGENIKSEPPKFEEAKNWDRRTPSNLQVAIEGIGCLKRRPQTLGPRPE